MIIKNVFSFVKIFAFKEGTAAVRAIILVANNACFVNSAKFPEVIEDVFVLPNARHLSNEKPHINSSAF